MTMIRWVLFLSFTVLVSASSSASPTNVRRRLTEENDKHRRVFLQYHRGRKHDTEELLIVHAKSVYMHYVLDDLNALVLTASIEDLETLHQGQFRHLVSNIEDDPPRYPQFSSSGEDEERTVFDMPYGLDMVHAPALWEKGMRGQGITVCVVDSGLDPFHNDFESDHIHGSDIVLPWYEDGIGHGTHISGLIAGKYTGVAPEAKLHVVRVFDGHGDHAYASDIIVAAKECVAVADSKIVNLSLGGPDASRYEEALFQELTQHHDVIVVAAAGSVSGEDSSFKSYPAAYSNTVSVAAVGSKSSLASFSNRDNSLVDLAAPGLHVWSTLPMYEPCVMCSILNQYEYGRLSGTSMAAAHVSGVMALLLSYDDANNYWSSNEIVYAVQTSAKAIPDSTIFFGIVDGAAAFERLVHPTSTIQESHLITTTSPCPILGQVQVWLKIRTDAYPEDTSFTLTNIEEGSEVWNYSNLLASQQFNFKTCVEDDQCHVLRIIDSYGDGLCCKYGMGGYEVLYDGKKVQAGAIFGDREEVKLGPCDDLSI